MQLFIVRSQYNYHAAEHKSFLRPILHTIDVLKETAKNYQVVGEDATGYHSRISKDNLLYASSPEDAWDMFISRIALNLFAIKKNVIEGSDVLEYAKLQRRLIRG